MAGGNLVFCKFFLTISFKQLLTGFISFLFFIFLIYHLFFYWDFKNSCYITIRPSFTEFGNVSIKDGIKFLRSNFPRQYREFCMNVSSIDPNISCGGYGGGVLYGPFIQTKYDRCEHFLWKIQKRCQGYNS